MVKKSNERGDTESIIAKESIAIPKEILLPLEEVKARMNQICMEALKNNTLYEPIMHFVSKPGKLIRPAIVLTSSLIIGIDINSMIDMAAAIEMLHISSLIHDDIIDKDTKRRDKETINAKYGNDTAIIAGDALIAIAVNTVSKYGSRVLDITSKASLDMCKGEHLDSLAQEHKKVLNIEEYLEVAKLKTGVLIATAAQIPAIYSNNSNAEAFKEFGLNLGISFQIRDDILNYLKKDHLKNTGNDIENFRPNIVASLSKESNPIKSAINKNNEYLEKAKSSLEKINNSNYLIPYLNFLTL
ncbi:MAG: polyprenyl synthetase family protein [Candidatus Micrarchaeia archaeon]